ncbi:LAGLIDADG family homing endonuclease [Rhodococcus rhodochrous]|uniref:LAGLIDADG family homing endonuclease n=1 Tax=Rhodococcus rhodochrous TaxID=1829 RepID=UPI00177B0286|nr:LAGLIDADG family homing endonuclease [Rhodococcus rhodochrous]QOH55247.1 hypothetical protein C6Y44_04125 [Rhodococcus rhodochrous]
MPTLGYAVIDWITTYLAAPAKDEYEPFVPYLEQEDFILAFYEIDPETGRFRRNRGLLGRPRGWGKSPLLAALAIVEALAPVLPDGWDAYGQPVGKPWTKVRTPLVQIAAVSEEQTNNTWQPMLEMLREGPVIDEYRGLEPLDTVVNLPRGHIKSVTSSSRTVKGAPSTFAVLDQALALDTPIPTPDGWRLMGELETGDWVFGTEGPVRISAAKPVSTEHDCYRVTFSDGTSVVASAGHLWLTRRVGWPARYERVRTTEEMLDGYKYRIPAAQPIPLPEASLPVHPYLLGVWLGDGTRGKCEITVSEKDLDALQTNLAQIGVESWPRRYAPTADGWSTTGSVNLTFTRARGFAMCERPEPAKALSAMACYRDKHIPEDYLSGSIEQRTQLLRGLMDADGCVTTQGTCTFVNTNRRLADGVVRLLRSLGQTTSCAKFVVDDRYSQGGKYRVDFTPRGGLIPVALPRKVERVKQQATRGPGWVSIVAIEPVDRVPVRCIAVESDDHLFAFGEAGHFTHNTEEWVPSNGGPLLAQTIRTNTSKNGGRTVESPNAFIPGEGSVAEQSAAYWADIRQGRVREEGLLYDHREAPPDTSLTDRESPSEDSDEEFTGLIDGLRYAYGDSSGHPDGCVIHDPPCAPGHVDLDALVSRIWDPATDIQIARSDFLNQITHASDSWVRQPDWAARLDVDKVIGSSDPIVLGFDGSRGRNRGKADATALVGCRVSDGHMFEIRVWEQPAGPAGRDWAPSVLDVDSTVRACMDQWNVVGFYADPSGWTSQVAAWEAKYGRKLKVKASAQSPIAAWPRGKDSRVIEYVERMRLAIVNGEMTHDGGPSLTRHVLNARRRNVRNGYLIFKAYPDSPEKIDAAYAAVMAWKARIDAIAKGIGKPVKKRKAVTL